MKWWLAKIVYRIICGEGNHTAQFDEQLRLIEATSRETAFKKSQAIGKAQEEAFYNQKNQLVKWQFINVSELYPLSNLVDGAELYSRIEEIENAEAYVYTVNQKAGNIFISPSRHSLQLV